jgi:hypothetical protein
LWEGRRGDGPPALAVVGREGVGPIILAILIPLSEEIIPSIPLAYRAGMDLQSRFLHLARDQESGVRSQGSRKRSRRWRFGLVY